MLFLLAAILAGLLVTKPAIATAPYNQIDSEYISEDIIIKDNAIQAKTPIQVNRPSISLQGPPDRRHSTRAEKTIPVEKLQAYLEQKGSPLAPYAGNILESSYWSTILGICKIEQSKAGGICNRLPGGQNWNLWGIGGASGLNYYSTAEEGIAAISDLLTKYEARGYDTIEKLNGYYVQPASSNWFNVVLRTKQELESL